MFLKIQITGKGRIPRIGGIAPRMTPIKAEPDFIKLIMSTPGLGIRYYNPEENKFVPLTNKNMQAVLNMYGNWNYDNKSVTNITTSPIVPKENIIKTTSIENNSEIKVGEVIKEEHIEIESKVDEGGILDIKEDNIKNNNTIKPIYIEEASTSKVDISDEDVPLVKKEEVNKNNYNNKKKNK